MRRIIAPLAAALLLAACTSSAKPSAGSRVPTVAPTGAVVPAISPSSNSACAGPTYKPSHADFWAVVPGTCQGFYVGEVLIGIRDALGGPYAIAVLTSDATLNCTYNGKLQTVSGLNTAIVGFCKQPNGQLTFVLTAPGFQKFIRVATFLKMWYLLSLYSASPILPAIADDSCAAGYVLTRKHVGTAAEIVDAANTVPFRDWTLSPQTTGRYAQAGINLANDGGQIDGCENARPATS